MDKTILVAVVSAISAVVGVLISQVSVLLKEHLSKKHLKQILLREKYEELADCIQAAMVASNQAAESTSISELMKFCINEPLRKAMSLSLIYFPEFKDAVGAFQNAYISHYDVMAKSYHREVNETVGTQAVFHNRKAYIETAERLVQTRHEIDLLVEKYAYKYAKA
ncbi:TPA: hypothetical protein NKA88_004593 [Vibrio parahaemolyticus]|uniref:hypothetical protein n=1 Tax=Vibrio harveyi group TaxID=717610 RepID=UPI00079FFAF1|nr:hypothetical protein [Vibrio parahaemolyticus]EGQ8527949.1 hypothetical protein [Vibrio parahaemolyticus]EGQ9211978.1 hypothetical protein [Vibrio parahaemolyticus]EGQ9789760.1 hypothetical protein [Vibrio parahaemolyticus]EGQ9926438.1 hypothetical protein [Vibrio parahaemolyticus]EGR0121253.1 hypothetical protein [Vibrio parahaemolyticus]